MRRFLIVSGVMFAALIIICGVVLVRFSNALTQADPYPTFMADYELGRSHSYEEAKHTFSDFVAKTFPVGSDVGDAVALITKSDFQVTTSASEAVELVWKPHNGPCNEHYSIAISRDPNGRIAKVVGRLRPICL